MEYENENQDSDNAKELSFSFLNWFLTMVKKNIHSRSFKRVYMLAFCRLIDFSSSNSNAISQIQWDITAQKSPAILPLKS